MILALGLLLTLAAAFLACYAVLRKKEMHLWIGSYLKHSGQAAARRNSPKSGPVDVLFCVVDHFEPMWERPSYETEVRRVDEWVKKYAELAKKHKDGDGVHPQHTFFYPEEEYRKEHLDKIAQLCRDGFGEVEIHLHHDNDTADGFREKLERFKKTLQAHSLLSSNGDGKLEYSFVHGNWALDNSRRDGRMCGVNNELQILRETGCYADFTLPSAPDQTQTKKINAIYYAKDHPGPKSHDDGVDAEAGKQPSGDLLMIQGPLALNWSSRKWGLLPRIENADLCAEYPPSPARADLWIRKWICVRGREDWVFVKVHTHGTQEPSMPVLLGRPMDETFSHLEKVYNDGKKFRLHYVNAREMYNIVKAAEDGRTGNAGQYRDYRLKKIQWHAVGKGRERHEK